jgi:hypothetical protein
MLLTLAYLEEDGVALLAALIAALASITATGRNTVGRHRNHRLDRSRDASMGRRMVRDRRCLGSAHERAAPVPSKSSAFCSIDADI